MGVENIGESQETLIKNDAVSQDSGEVIETTKNKESKLILYHLTQSFSSQTQRTGDAAKDFMVSSKLFDHDNMKYLKKLSDELENVLDQVETELQRRVEDTPEEGNQQAWLCLEFFSIANVSLAVTLHRLKFLGLSHRYWGNGVNLETYYDRVLNRPTLRRVLGQVNNILVSAVLAKKKAPTFVGAMLLIGLLGGPTYLAFHSISILK